MTDARSDTSHGMAGPREDDPRPDPDRPPVRSAAAAADPAGPWFEALVETAAASVITTTVDGTVTRWNGAAARLFGRSAADALGRQLPDALPRSAAAIADIVRRLAAEAAAEPEEFSLSAVLRIPTDLLVRAVPVRDDLGAMLGVAVVVRDVTDEGAALETFRQSVEHSPVGKLLVDSAGRIVLVNIEIENRFGYNRAELLGQSVTMLLPRDRRAQHDGLVAAYIARPEQRAMGGDREVVGRHKDGTTFPVEVGLTPVRLRGGLHVLAAVIDLSQQKSIQAALEEHARALERSNADLEQFAYVASHDLQEPLRIVASFTELLANRYRGEIDERADKYIDFIVDGARRMQALINDLLVYSRLGAEAKPHEPVSLYDLVQRVRSDLAVQVAEAGATLASDDLPTVIGDADQLRRVLQNLISNAIKFRGGAPPEIVISAVRDGRMWRIDVRDNGIGFKDADAKRIFEMFQRLHPRGTYGGTGLGLAICRRIVDQHGGTIWATATPGAGSTFSFTLPAKR